MTPKEAYSKSGEIASSVLKLAREHVVEGRLVEEICEELEDIIRSKGGVMAFPCNISQNSEAAHYSAAPGDERKIERGAIVKVDIGVQVDGFIADTAFTVNFNPTLNDMVSANNTVLMDALKVIRRDVNVGLVGEVVELEANRRGYRPIINLAGHQLDQYIIHAGVSVPNVKERVESSFKVNSAYAIEPFLVPKGAKGWVMNGPPGNIYRLISRKRSKEKEVSDAIELIWSKFKGLPFSSRWFVREMGVGSAMAVLEKMLRQRFVMTYPVLMESTGAPVSQFEHTVFVGEDGTMVTTI